MISSCAGTCSGAVLDSGTTSEDATSHKASQLPVVTPIERGERGQAAQRHLKYVYSGTRYWPAHTPAASEAEATASATTQSTSKGVGEVLVRPKRSVGGYEDAQYRRNKHHRWRDGGQHQAAVESSVASTGLWSSPANAFGRPPIPQRQSSSPSSLSSAGDDPDRSSEEVVADAANTLADAGMGMARSFMVRLPRTGRRYDVPQIGERRVILHARHT